MRISLAKHDIVILIFFY